MMAASVERPPGDAPHERRVRVVLRPPIGPAVLEHRTHLGGDVHLGVDLFAPGCWRSVTFSMLDSASRPFLRALLGPRYEDALRAAEQGGDVTVDPVGAAPWLRIACVDALDRWLHAPLEQCLIDAERGIVRGWAARTLPAGRARTAVTGEALRLAHRAAGGLVAFLAGLSRNSPTVPSGLHLALSQLVGGYADLIGEVRRDGARCRDEPEPELTAVLEQWRHLERRAADFGHPESETRRPPAGGRDPARPHPRAASMIDPRRVRSRILALSSDPLAAEISLSAPPTGGLDAVRVRVPAFRGPLDPDVLARLAVRLVDRRSGETRGHALLDLVTDDAHDGPYFEAMVPLCGLPVGDVRADVIDVLDDAPPSPDPALHDVRRAVALLGEVRRLAGLVQLPAARTSPARGLSELAALLQRGQTDDALPVFAANPIGTELHKHVEQGDRAVTDQLRDGPCPIGRGPLSVPCGPAALLVAELAAAHLAA